MDIVLGTLPIARQPQRFSHDPSSSTAQLLVIYSKTDQDACIDHPSAAILLLAILIPTFPVDVLARAVGPRLDTAVGRAHLHAHPSSTATEGHRDAMKHP